MCELVSQHIQTLTEINVLNTCKPGSRSKKAIRNFFGSCRQYHGLCNGTGLQILIICCQLCLTFHKRMAGISCSEILCFFRIFCRCLLFDRLFFYAFFIRSLQDFLFFTCLFRLLNFFLFLFSGFRCISFRLFIQYFHVGKLHYIIVGIIAHGFRIGKHCCSTVLSICFRHNTFLLQILRKNLRGKTA